MNNELIKIDDSKLELIKNTIAKGATNDELALFKYICEKRQLDPFAKQIYWTRRRQWNSAKNEYEETSSTQTGIDGFRLIAERSGKYAGQLGPFFTDDGVTWLDCWIKDTPPKAAKLAVLRSDFREPIWAMARFNAYCPRDKSGNPTGQWKTMGDGQLAKCAEALALRRAFPEELSGLYTSDEMHQAVDITPLEDVQIQQHPMGELSEEETPRAAEQVELVMDAAVVEVEEYDGDAPASLPDTPCTDAEKESFKAYFASVKGTRDEKLRAIQSVPGWTTVKAMTKGQMEAAIKKLEEMK